MTLQLETATTNVAAQCFLNALIRETWDWQIAPAVSDQQYPQLHIPLSSSHAIRITLRHISPTQHHHYLFPAYLHRPDDRADVAISVEQLVTLLLEKPAVKVNSQKTSWHVSVSGCWTVMTIPNKRSRCG